MKQYELLFILPGTLAESEVPEAAAKVETMLTGHGVEALAMHDLGKNRLAYPMKHIRYGYFRLARFSADPQSIQSLQRKLTLSGEFLRAIIQVYDPKKPTEPAILQSTRDARGARKGGDMTVPEMETAPEKKVKAVEEPKEEEKVTMEDIGKKLDEILDKEIESV